MTPQEAIKIIKGKICCEEPIQHYCDDSCMYSTKPWAFALAISVLEKQVPKNVRKIERTASNGRTISDNM